MSAPAPIAYLCSVYPRASDTFVRTEVAELRRRGWTLHTFAVRHPPREEIVSPALVAEQGSTTYLLTGGLMRLAWSGLRCFATAPRRSIAAFAELWRIGQRGIPGRVRVVAWWLEAAVLAKALQSTGVRHLHTHIAGSAASVALAASRLTGVPFSMTVHGLELLEPTLNAIGAKVAASSFTVCISEQGRSQCMIHAPLESWSKLHVVRCSPAPEFVQPEELRTPVAPVFLCVGRFSPEKGQDLLLEAAARLKQEGVRFALKLGGDGPERAKLEARSRALGLDGCVEFLGWLSSPQVRAAILDASVLVVPSLTEGIPVIIMEAMVSSRAVIATRVGGTHELVESGVTGWLVQPGAVESLVEAMRTAAATPGDELQRMARRGRERVLALHDVTQNVAALGRLIEASLEAPGPRTR